MPIRNYSSNVIRFIVKQLAFYTEPIDIVYQVRELYDIDITTDEIVQMNPALPSLCVLDDNWIYQFQESRAQMIDSVEQLPVMDKLRRLRALQSMYEECQEKGDLETSLKILDMARTETQGLFNEFVMYLRKTETSNN
jgi:hypothetical protein